jgi:AcrR family transcriptional regulator
MRSQAAAEELRESLVQHALALVARDGASALTMRALAAEAGCALGLPYKVFAHRGELVAQMMRGELQRLQRGFDVLLARAGTRTVGDNLVWFADLLLDSPAVALGDEIHGSVALQESALADFRATGVAASFGTILPAYLRAEQGAGRIAEGVDVDAFGFVIVGALHNLLASGPGYPQPSRRQLRHHLRAVATQLAPTHERTAR